MFSFIFYTTLDVLGIVGMWMLFKKCNIKSILAIIPVVNKYKLAQCADDVDSGAIWCITDFFLTCFYIAETVLEVTNHTKGTYYDIIIILFMVFAIIKMIYSVRIYTELCNILGKRKLWVVPLVFFEGAVLLYFGASKDIVPSRIVNGNTVDESGKVASNLSEGLTINIDKRTARNMLFFKKTLLKDIHININPGKMVLLLGGSGAGKTTFINAITGYEKADASIILNGNDVYRDYTKVIYDIGMVPQQELVRRTDTVFSTLMDSAALRMPANVSIHDRRKRVHEVMDIFGLTPVKNSMVGKLSGGQKKRISIAMEYISDPSLFILDEPDSGLDGILAKELMKKLHDISREGKIVIVVTHTPDRVIDLFDEIIVLAKDEMKTGRLVFNGPVDKAKEFFNVTSMEEIIKIINRVEEGGLGKADELLKKFNDMHEEVKVNE